MGSSRHNFSGIVERRYCSRNSGIHRYDFLRASGEGLASGLLVVSRWDGLVRIIDRFV